MVSGASEGGKDTNKASATTIILLGGGLLLSAIAALLGVGSLILAFYGMSIGGYENYMAACIATPPGLVLPVLGIVGLRACVRRIRVLGGEPSQGMQRPGREPAREVPVVDTGGSRQDAREPAEPLVCPECGSSNPPDSIFCLKCGATLPAVEAKPAAAGQGRKDVNKGSLKTEILLAGGLLLSAIMALFGAGLLLMAIGILLYGLLGNYLDSYIWPGIVFGAILGPVFLVPGILGAKAGVRRIKAEQESILGPRLALFMGAGMFLVLLLAGIAIAWANRPLNHYEGAPYESPRTAALTPRPTRMPLAMPTPGGPTPTPWTVAPNPEHPGWTTYTTAEGLVGDGVSAVALAPDGAVWFGSAGRDGGASRFDGTTWTTYTTADGLSSENVSAIAFAPDGAAWFGTYDRGVSRFDGETWTNGLSDLLVGDIALAPDGTLWFGTILGASRFDGQDWTTYTKADGLARDDANAVVVAPDGTVWFGTGAGVSRFDGQDWTTSTAADGLVDNKVWAIAVAPDGAVWFGTSSSASRFDGQTWTTYTTADGLANDEVWAIAVTPDGVVWFGTSGGASRFDGTTWTTYTTADGLADDQVNDIAVGPDGAVWFGTGGGVSRYLPPR
jgi:streptogramin lyase